MIEKNYPLEKIKIKVMIEDGVAIMTTNNPQVTKQMYDIAIKGKRAVAWEARENAMVEKFLGKTKEEIAFMMDRDFQTALIKQKEASEYAKRRK